MSEWLVNQLRYILSRLMGTWIVWGLVLLLSYWLSFAYFRFPSHFIVVYSICVRSVNPALRNEMSILSWCPALCVGFTWYLLTKPVLFFSESLFHDDWIKEDRRWIFPTLMSYYVLITIHAWPAIIIMLTHRPCNRNEICKSLLDTSRLSGVIW